MFFAVASAVANAGQGAIAPCTNKQDCQLFSCMVMVLVLVLVLGSGTTIPRLFGGSRLSESRNVLTDGSIGSEWSRLQRHFEILTKGSRRAAAGWSCLNLDSGPI